MTDTRCSESSSGSPPPSTPTTQTSRPGVFDIVTNVIRGASLLGIERTFL
jgi:hypothetical protein